MASDSKSNASSSLNVASTAESPSRDQQQQQQQQLKSNESSSRTEQRAVNVESRLSDQQSKPAANQSQSRLQQQSQNHTTPTPTIQSTSSNTQISSPPLPPQPGAKNSLPPIVQPSTTTTMRNQQPQNSYNAQPSMSSKANSNASLLNGRRPQRLEPIDTAHNRSPSQSVIKPISYYGGANNSKSNESFKRSKQNTSTSLDGTKKIVRWHLWWDRSQSNLRVPSYELPPKQVPSKIGSLENIKYRPGGGNMAILNEKLEWNKKARIDHVARGYKPGGGNMSILNEKLNWNTESKIGSLANISHKPGGGNISIVDMPFDKSTARSKIDSGFVFEEVIVPTDYELNSPRPSHFDSFREQTTGRRSKA